LQKRLKKTLLLLSIFTCIWAQEDTTTDAVLLQEETIESIVTDDIAVAAVRIANMLPDVPMIDLSVDGRLEITDIVYGDASDYVLVPVEKTKLILMPHVPINEQGEVIKGNQAPQPLTFTPTLEPDRYYTIVFSFPHTNQNTNQSEQQIFNASLITIFENTFVTPLPGQARVRFNNISAEPTNVRVEQETDQEERTLLGTLTLPLLSTEVLNISAGSYVLSFGEDNVELDLDLQAGTFYTFYVFWDGEDLVVNPDIDGVLGMLIGEN
jgi:hypothetical protein